MKTLIIIRLIILCLAAAVVRELLPLDLSYPVLLGGVVVGSAFSILMSRLKLTFTGFVAVLGIMTGLCIGATWLGESMLPHFTALNFTFDIFEDSFVIFLGLDFIFALTQWFFIRTPGFPTFELIGIAALILAVFSSHQNFSFDNPKLLNDLAWSLNVDPLAMLIAAGSSLSVFVITYGTLIARWELLSLQKFQLLESNQNRPRRAVALALLLAIMGGIGYWLFGFYHQEQLVRTANGVGQESTPGMSPLGFNSAMGSTNQPAALVRLDNDYTENPFSPMLYFRESALSSMVDNQLVIATGDYDTDLHRTNPSERYSIEAPTVFNRKKLSFSAYLLTTHNLAFAVDYPISLLPIKNPNPEKFKGAFQAISLVPTFPLTALEGVPAGDSHWSKETRDHYLQPHKDPRYAELAAKITGNKVLSPAAAANAIAQYLSANSIYTLTPNHSVPKNEDQVAPYLFGDMRGYCVHFAHATVFMLRALGIPSRIGTGYLTDLSKAKDGHILLRVSDRHAWAEAYFEGFGWIPFDTKPTQVESHADSEMDFKLLEELMGMIGTDEFLPKENTIKEPALERPTPFSFPIKSFPWFTIMCSILGTLIVLKLWIRYSWILPSSQATKVFRIYRSLYSVFIDLGEPRKTGETFTEYQSRLSVYMPGNPLQFVTPVALEQKFKNTNGKASSQALHELLQKERQTIRSLPRLQRVIAVLNPTSSLLLFRRGWR